MTRLWVDQFERLLTQTNHHNHLTCTITGRYVVNISVGTTDVLSESQLTLPLATLRAGDTPIYIRLAQEDGHMAWTSPLYVVRSAE